jgi:probable non-F420 flavinoid oxidoreductase
LRLGFHASHEQHPPSELLAAVRAAEAAGFEAAMCSDHIAPWTSTQGHSGHAWSWLGAALQATSLPLGVVTAPGQRYHPAVIAQAIATLGELFPDRLWAALGSGEAINEHVTGDPWPPKHERDQRLDECARVMRALLDGDEVDHRGRVIVDRARLWSLPANPPPLYAAAVGPETAGRVAAWADGLVTIYQPEESLRRVVGTFRDAGGATKPVAVQVHLSWHPDEAEAERMAHEQWAFSVLGAGLTWDLAQPEQFEAAARFVRPEHVRSTVLVSCDLGWLAARLAELDELGVDVAYLHPVDHLRPTIDALAEHVLPQLSTGGRAA